MSIWVSLLKKLAFWAGWRSRERKLFYFFHEGLFVLVLVKNKNQCLDWKMDLVLQYIALFKSTYLKYHLTHSPIL